MTLLPVALNALKNNWSIFPVNPCGTTCPESGDLIDKHPHLLWPGKPWKLKWGDVATRDPAQAVRWWSQSPQANIGIAMKPSGLMVVDCDQAKGDRTEDGLTQFLKVCTDVLRLDPGVVCDTYTVVTGSGGVHLYYQWPEGVLASQAGLAAFGAPDVDIRSGAKTRGGYVLGAGSVTTKGPYVCDYDTAVRPCPPELVELCREKPKPARVSPLFSQPGHASYGGLVDTVRYAAEGNRNDACNWAAWAMANDGATEEEAMQLLLPAAAECGLSEKEAMDTVKSAFRRAG